MIACVLYSSETVFINNKTFKERITKFEYPSDLFHEKK